MLSGQDATVRVTITKLGPMTPTDPTKALQSRQQMQSGGTTGGTRRGWAQRGLASMRPAARCSIPPWAPFQEISRAAATPKRCSRARADRRGRPGTPGGGTQRGTRRWLSPSCCRFGRSSFVVGDEAVESFRRATTQETW